MSWIQGFLLERKQKIVLNGYSSNWADVLSGVPQGYQSVLSPLMFSIYVNDVPDIVDSPILLFADDIKIFRCIKTQLDSLQL